MYHPKNMTRLEDLQPTGGFRGALLVQPRSAGDRLVANWQHIESGAVKMVRAAVAEIMRRIELGDRLIEVS